MGGDIHGKGGEQLIGSPQDTFGCLYGGHEHEEGREEGGARSSNHSGACSCQAGARAIRGRARNAGARAGVGGEGEAFAGGAEFAHERPERREGNPSPSQGRRREPIGS